MYLLYFLLGETVNRTSISDFRSRIGDYLGHLGGAPVVLERHGKPTAVVYDLPERPMDIFRAGNSPESVDEPLGTQKTPSFAKITDATL